MRLIYTLTLYDVTNTVHLLDLGTAEGQQRQRKQKTARKRQKRAEEREAQGAGGPSRR